MEQEVQRIGSRARKAGKAGKMHPLFIEIYLAEELEESPGAKRRTRQRRASQRVISQRRGVRGA